MKEAKSKIANLGDDEIARRETAALSRLLATPPDHKQGEQARANPKKRGRPHKATGENANTK
jgi:hypothetical protein